MEEIIKLNPNTQKARTFIRRYFLSKMENLYSVYLDPSSYKKCAWISIQNKKNQDLGRKLKITGYNCNKFSAAYLMDDRETGEEKIRYYTADYTYDIPLAGVDVEHIVNSYG